MKKLGKKIHSAQETIEAYRGDCASHCITCNCGYVSQASANQYYAYYNQLYGNVFLS